jgi:hypothetical protein
LHVSVHALFAQAGCPFGSLVVHTWLPPSAPAQPPQLPAVLVVSTQAPLHTVCDALGQEELHVKVSVDPDPTQTGVLPVQAFPQPPQFNAVSYDTQPPLQRL